MTNQHALSTGQPVQFRTLEIRK